MSALSSMSKTRLITNGSCIVTFSAALAALATAAASAAMLADKTGSKTVNSLPRPTPSLSTLTLPSCICAMVLTRLSPMPRPPRLVPCPAAPCVNNSKIRGLSSAEMPMPGSWMAMATCALSTRADIRITALSAENFEALISRLEKSWVSRTGSPSISTSSTGRSISMC